MARGQPLLLFTVRGKETRSHAIIKRYFYQDVFTIFNGKQDEDIIILVKTVKLDIHTSYEKRMAPIAFQHQSSRSHTTYATYYLNLGNKVKTESFWLGSLNFIHILGMAKGRQLFLLKVTGQRSIPVWYAKYCKQDQGRTVWVQPSNLVHILIMARGLHLLLLKVGVKEKVHNA